MSYPDHFEILRCRSRRRRRCACRVEEHYNRALVLAALAAKGYAAALRGALRSEDTEIMIEALRALGFRVLTDWPESTIYVSSDEDGPIIPAKEADLFVANSARRCDFSPRSSPWVTVAIGSTAYRACANGLSAIFSTHCSNLASMPPVRRGWLPPVVVTTTACEAARAHQGERQQSVSQRPDDGGSVGGKRRGH